MVAGDFKYSDPLNSLNLVTRTVQLVSPCRADDRRPKGYRVYEEGRFADAVELRTILERRIERYMALNLRGTDRVRLRPDLRVQRLGISKRFPAKLRVLSLRRWRRVTVQRKARRSAALSG